MSSVGTSNCICTLPHHKTVSQSGMSRTPTTVVKKFPQSIQKASRYLCFDGSGSPVLLRLRSSCSHRGLASVCSQRLKLSLPRHPSSSPEHTLPSLSPLGASSLPFLLSLSHLSLVTPPSVSSSLTYASPFFWGGGHWSRSAFCCSACECAAAA